MIECKASFICVDYPILTIDELAKKEIIMEQMQYRRDNITHLTDGSRKILSRSRERSQKRQREIKKSHLGKSQSSVNILSSPGNPSKVSKDSSIGSTVHHRLYNESSILNQNRSMMQFKESMRIKRMVKYGSKSRSRSPNAYSKMISSKSESTLGSQVPHLKNIVSPTGRYGVKLTKKRSKQNLDSSDMDTDALAITAKLYSDAVRRQDVLKKLQKEHSKSPKRSKAALTTKASLNVLKDRFLKDFKKVIKKKKLKQKLNYHHTEAILKELGFMTSKSNSDETEEKVLFVDLWGCLHGDIDKKVDKGNLKVLLGAIQGFEIEHLSCSKDQSITDFKAYLSPEAPDGQQSDDIKIDFESSNLSNHQTDRRINDSKNYQDSSRDTSKF